MSSFDKLTQQALGYILEQPYLDLVREFHNKHGIIKDLDVKNQTIADLRFDLIAEELQEFGDAIDDRDKIAIADALGDILYVTFGAAEVYGIDIDRVFREIHRSNMTKISDGGQNEKIHKIMKGPEYSPPDLSFVMED